MTVNTSDHPVTVVRGGTETRLDTLAYNISTKGGIGGSMAALRGSSAVLPGRSGSLYQPGKKREEGTSILSMWAQSTDADGVEASDPYLQWRTNQDKLLMLFDTANEQVELREYLVRVPLGASLAGKPYRRAFIEVRSAIDPEMLGQAFGQFKVECVRNETYWEDWQEQTWTSPIGAGAVATHSVDLLNGMTAPVEDAEVTVFGPATEPVVTDPRSGHWVKLYQTVADGSSWVVNCDTWESRLDGANVTADTSASGLYAPRLFGLSANDGAPQVQFSATGTGANTKLQIKARRKFH